MADKHPTELEMLEVPRELLAEIAADAGPFKDTARLMIEPAPAG